MFKGMLYVRRNSRDICQLRNNVQQDVTIQPYEEEAKGASRDARQSPANEDRGRGTQKRRSLWS
jgi:hypothetical protein